MRSMKEPTPPLASYSVGAGPRATVLLHGFLGSGKNLRTLAQRWSEAAPERRLWLPDLPGHGDSPPLAPDSDLDCLAAGVLAGATAAGLTGPLSIVGHSLGGRVALAAARRAPDRLRDVVLLDITPGPIDPARSETRRVLEVLLDAPAEAADRREVRAFFLGRGLSPGLADWLLMNLRSEDGRFRWRIDRQALAVLHDRSMAEDLWPVVERAAVPIRLIRGERSSYVSAADAQRLAAAGGRVDTLAGVGHYVHVDALEALLAALL
jgi:pimeloyl-ACP methyl ester carboxylesterase